MFIHECLILVELIQYSNVANETEISMNMEAYMNACTFFTLFATPIFFFFTTGFRCDLCIWWKQKRTKVTVKKQRNTNFWTFSPKMFYIHDIYNRSSCSAPLRSVIAPRQNVVTNCVNGSGLPSSSPSSFFFFSASSNDCYTKFIWQMRILLHLS